MTDPTAGGAGGGGGGGTVRDESGIQRIHINDFSPGIFDANLIVPVPPIAGAGPGGAAGPFPAPIGSADANYTYGCMNLEQGGLGPLPAMTQSHSLADYGLTIGPGVFGVSLIGFTGSYIASHVNDRGIDELIMLYSQMDAGGATMSAYANSFVWNDLTSVHNIWSLVGYNHAGYWPGACCWPYTTRVAPSAPTTTVGVPVLVLPISIVGAPTTGGFTGGYMNLYPDPALPTAFSTQNIVFDTHPVGYGFGHQGRVVGLMLTQFQSPVGGNIWYEAISYTDPPNSTNWGAQDAIFGPENPQGYGTVSSVSAGELFMVKCRGGAVIVQGDINNPTVTTLPGVKSTGAIYGHPGVDANGTYYCSLDNGAWLWNGGNASQKISRQLDDAFFTPNPPMPVSGVVNPNIQPYGYYAQRWGGWMLFSNNWVFNTATGSWWRLYNPSAVSFFYYVPGVDEGIMYAAPTQIASATAPIFFRFDKTVPTNNYTWQSLPIRPQAADRTIEVREVVVRAANVNLDPAAQITVSVLDNQGNVNVLSAWNLPSSTKGVQIHTFNAGVFSDDIVVRLTASSLNAAPIVYDLNIGYRTRQQAART